MYSINTYILINTHKWQTLSIRVCGVSVYVNRKNAPELTPLANADALPRVRTRFLPNPV